MKTSILCLIAATVWISCDAQRNSDTSTDPLPKVFPGESWQTTKPESLGYSSKKLEKAEEQFEEIGGVAGLVIVKGYIIADWGATDANIGCRSMRKSLINSLYGIEQSQGTIDFNSNLEQLEINEGDQLSADERSATVNHLMNSSSGIYVPAAFDEQAHRNKPARGSAKAGEVFFYNNWDFNALSTIYNSSTGTDLFLAFDDQIAKPLQMEHFNGLYNSFYISQPSISEHPAYLFRMSTKDLARYGLLYLNEGNWDGRQLVPKEWVLKSTQTQIETGEDFYYNYGYLWWTNKRQSVSGRSPFLARGAESQYMYIDPANELIIIFRDNPDDLARVSKGQAYPLIGAVYGAMMQ